MGVVLCVISQQIDGTGGFSPCWCTPTLEASESPGWCSCRWGSYKDALLLFSLTTSCLIRHCDTRKGKGCATSANPSPEITSQHRRQRQACEIYGRTQTPPAPNCREQLQGRAFQCTSFAPWWSQQAQKPMFLALPLFLVTVLSQTRLVHIVPSGRTRCVLRAVVPPA